MNRRIAVLRGINVGGRRKILMADLKALFVTMGFSNISTYIQSGNVFFDSFSEMNNLNLAKKIKHAIKKAFDFDVPVIVRTPTEIEEAINKNPFYSADTDIGHLHLTFLGEEPADEQIAEAEAHTFSPDKFSIQGKHVFIYCEGKYHKSKLTNSFFEKKLKVNATTRNWKTVLKLHERAQ